MATEHTGSIVAYLPDFGEDLTVPGGVPVDDLHVTLVYLTDDHTELTTGHRAAIAEVMAAHPTIIEGDIVGAQFLGQDDPQATVLMLDAPALHVARNSIKAALAEAGVPVPEDTYPEYLPHITVGYGTPLADAEKMVGKRFTLGTLAAFYGPDREHVALNVREGSPMADTKGQRFFAPSIARMGVPTGDRRLIMPDAISYRTLPIAYRWQEFDAPGHDGAVVVGAVDQIEIDPVTGNVSGYGELADEAIIPEVKRVKELMRLGVLGISIDPGEVIAEQTGDGWTLFHKYEISSFTALPIPAFADTRVMLVDEMDMIPAPAEVDVEIERDCEDDTVVPEGEDWMYALTASVRSEGWADMPVYPADTEWDGSAAADRVLAWASDGDVVDWDKYKQAFLYQDSEADPETKGAYGFGIADVTEGHLSIVPKGVYAVAGALSGARGGTTIPEADQAAMKTALAGIYKHMATALDDPSIEAPFSLESLTACAAERPPAAWFADPKLTGPTPITITADGQIFGHIGLHGQKHRGLPGEVSIPKSMSGYREFLLGGTVTAEGTVVPTGKITLGGGHADASLGAQPAVAHYDDVSTTVAVVSAGDDRFGVWVAGAIKAGTTDTQIDDLLQSPPSGDWRRDQLGHLELIGVHSVNVPGFAVYRVNADLQSGDVYALVASIDFSQVEPERVTFDLDGDLRAQFDAAGVAWPTISATVGGVEYGPFEVAPGCVASMLRGSEAPVVASVESEVSVSDEAQRRRAAARLALMHAGRIITRHHVTNGVG